MNQSELDIFPDRVSKEIRCVSTIFLSLRCSSVIVTFEALFNDPSGINVTKLREDIVDNLDSSGLLGSVFEVNPNSIVFQSKKSLLKGPFTPSIRVNLASMLQ